MKLYYKSLLVFLILTLSPYLLDAQELSTQGKSFWVTFYENYGGTAGCSDNSVPQLKIVISCNKATTGTVKNVVNNVSMPFSIGVGGGVDTVLVPASQGYTTGTESTSSRDKGLLITSNDTITVSAQNSKQYSCDATLVYPIEALGVEYRVISHPGDIPGNSSCYRSCFAVVATENSTVVEITPSVATAGGNAAGVKFSVTLQKGETYMVKANTNKLDLSGTLVQAKDCKKIALFSGSTRSAITFGSCAASYDQLYEQMMPTNMWGKKFIVIPTIYTKNKPRKADLIRVVSNQSSTTVRCNGRLKILSAAGQTDTFFVTTNSIIIANKPIGLCQLGISEDCDKVFGGSDTDPMMMWVPPVEQSLRNLTFVCENAQTINKFFLNVIVKTSYKSFFTLDGTTPSATWTPVAKDTSYSFIQQDGITLGKHTINSPYGFAAVLYAYGDHGSYGFNAGSSIKPLSFYSTVNGKSSADFEPDSLFYNVCQGASVPFDGGGSNLTGVTWKWIIKEKSTTTVKTSKSFTKIFTDTGRFQVFMIAQRPTNGTCNGQTSIDDTVESEVRVYQKPYIKLLNDTTICTGNSLYLTSTTDGDTNYTFNPAAWLNCNKCYLPSAKPLKDTFYAVSATYLGCTPSRDTVNIFVRDTFKMSKCNDTTICRGTSANLWTTGSGGLSTDLSVTWDHGLGTGFTKTVSPKTTTTYQAILTDNCTRDINGNFDADTLYIKVNVRDSLKITMPKDTIVCEGNQVLLKVKVTGGLFGASLVTWDNGPDTGLNRMVTLGSTNKTYKAVLSDACTLPNDSGYVTVNVRPSIKIDTIIYSNPVCKNQLFTIRAIASGGDSSGYKFKLFNTTSSAFVLIDSANGLTHPSFKANLPDDGTFSLRMNQSCNSHQVSKKFNVKIKTGVDINNPTPADTICTGQNYTLTINGTSLDNLPIKFVLKKKNGSTYSGVDSTSNLSTAKFIIFPPSVPTDYMITGDDNCSKPDTTYFRILTRVPVSLTALTNDELCRGESKSLTAVVSGGKVQSYKYKWTDVNTGLVIDSLKNSISIQATNSLDIKLEVGDGCSAPVNSTARIWVAPLVTDSLLCVIDKGCEPLSTYFIFPKTQSQTPLNPTFSWKWYFNGSNSNNENGSGGSTHQNINKNYTVAGNNNVKVEMVLSNGKICFSKNQNISVFQQALANFTYLPRQIDIVEPDVQFTNQSTGATDYKWTFGDGGNDTQEDPIHTYNDTGDFIVTLISTNINGCNDTTFQKLKVLDIYRIFIPEAFSPNSDEHNTIWQPSYTSILTCEVTIYNRWGEKIYFSNDNTGKWDGTYNGMGCEQGAYYYHLKVRDNRKKWHYYSGMITLIR